MVGKVGCGVGVFGMLGGFWCGGLGFLSSWGVVGVMPHVRRLCPPVTGCPHRLHFAAIVCPPFLFTLMVVVCQVMSNRFLFFFLLVCGGSCAGEFLLCDGDDGEDCRGEGDTECEPECDEYCGAGAGGFLRGVDVGGGVDVFCASGGGRCIVHDRVSSAGLVCVCFVCKILLYGIGRVEANG